MKAVEEAEVPDEIEEEVEEVFEEEVLELEEETLVSDFKDNKKVKPSATASRSEYSTVMNFNDNDEYGIDNSPASSLSKLENIFHFNSMEHLQFLEHAKEEEIFLYSKEYAYLLPKWKNLKTFKVLIDLVEDLELPRLEQLFIDVESISEEHENVFDNNSIAINKKYQERKVFPIELFHKLLEKQPILKTFAIRYHDEVDKFNPLYHLKILLTTFSSLERIHLFHNDGFLTIEKDEGMLNVVAFKETSYSKNYIIPEVIANVTTLHTLLLPNLRSIESIDTLIENNPNIKRFSCSWDNMSPKILSHTFETYKSDKSVAYHRLYISAKEEFQDVLDPKRNALFRLFITNNEVPFEANRETLEKLMQSKIRVIKKGAKNAYNSLTKEHKIYAKTSMPYTQELVDLLKHKKKKNVLEGLENIRLELSTNPLPIKIDDKLIPILLGIFKVYPNDKVRK
ncbi:MAG TPA: hypothetical protein EYP16_00375, partial [Candidatus Atribacteria bacterium]|nr:hypothetical protein [Candidatus Atribacteria bacterium]